MRKFLPILLILLCAHLFAQTPPSAVNDTVYANRGETIAINVIENDIDADGDPIQIENVNSTNHPFYIDHNDSIITFKIPEYVLETKTSIGYQLLHESFHPDLFGSLVIFINMPIIDTLEANQIRTPIYPMNIQFWDAYFEQGQSNFRYPKDSLTSTIFNAGLWIGGKTSNDVLHFAGERYRLIGHDFWPGPLSSDGNATTDSTNAGRWLRTWKVSREEINNHTANYDNPEYKMPEAIENWPAHGDTDLNQDAFIAPFVDVDQDLEYHPERGDYPFIRGDVSVFFVFNDQMIHTETQGEILGVEIHCMAWAFDDQRGGEPYNSTIFYSYKIMNKSTVDYFDTYLGMYSDMDLGFAYDDYVGCHVQNGNFYVYNGEPIDGNGEPESFGEKIPAQSICILSGPFMDADGLDNPDGSCDESINGSGFGDGEADNERFGMSRFVFFSNNTSLYGDPEVAAEYYDHLRGIWKDGSSVLYGGNGHSSGGGNTLFPTRFMFPGDSDPCHWGTGGVDPGALWTEETAGNNPNDRRGLASMGPFTFEAGSVEYLDIAYVTAPYTEQKSSKDLLQDYVAEIKGDYLLDPMDFGFQYTGTDELKKEANLLKVFPNPVDGDQIWFELEEFEQAEYTIYNSAGQEVILGRLPAQKQQQLNVGVLKSGWYLLEIKTTDKIYRSKLIK